MTIDLKQMYRTIVDENFPEQMEISFVQGNQRQTLVYEKVVWSIENVAKGLRYGENPGQEAALYRLANGNLVLGETETIQPGQYLVSDIERALLQERELVEDKRLPISSYNYSAVRDRLAKKGVKVSLNTIIDRALDRMEKMIGNRASFEWTFW